MAAGIIRQCVLFGHTTRLANRACLSTTCPCLIKWRYQKDIEPNPNRFGKLTNLPDYSFVNGQPVPIGVNAYKRKQLQEEYCKKIVTLCREIDFAVDRHRKMLEKSKEDKQNLITSKLKPKGYNLLKKKKECENSFDVE